MQNGFEDLRSDHQVMKALAVFEEVRSFFLIPILHWGMPCNARISQMELKELSVMALESRELMPIFSGCTLHMGTFWNLQSSNPRPLTEATTYNSNRKFTHEMAEDTGMERWVGRNMVVQYSFVKYQAA